MSRKFSTWLRSKSGLAALVGVVVLALAAAVVGQQFGWWGGPGAAGAPPEAVTCETLPTDYMVKNPATNPFYGINFVWTSGQQVMGGGADYFSFVLPASVAQELSSVRVQAKANPFVGEVILEACDFAGTEACNEPIADAAGRFNFQFVGAADNGDGNLRLTFWVQVVTSSPLANVAFGLPEGAAPSAPSGVYTGATCPAP